MERAVACQYSHLQNIVMSLFQDVMSEVSGLSRLWIALATETESLAKGLDITVGGQSYRVFVVTSLIHGDIPAVMEMCGLKRSASNFPCIYCKAIYRPDSNASCPFACARGGESSAKTNMEYMLAFQQSTNNPSRTLMTFAMVLYRGF